MTASLPELPSLLHRPRVVRILTVVDEAPSVKSLTFKDRLSAAARPGQFGMIWAPGVDETPMSLLPSGNGDIVTITVKDRGEGSRALVRKRTGDVIGIRGPYGKAFTHEGEKRVLMIAGGTGAIPLIGLLRTLAARGVQCNFVLGANTSHELLFLEEIRRLSMGTGGVFSVTTDDGSTGTKALATDEAAKLLSSKTFDRVYTCGPEAMMKKVLGLAEEAHVPMEAGLERIFKCGSGICGSCCIGPYLVCKDGPVFDSEVLRRLPEFGKSTRDASGRPVSIGTL
jgi:dihydroorotate dehydrogenase electron transfer subunit